MPTLSFDIETGSPRSLHEHGAWAYAACPDTRVWCLCFAVDDGEVQSWTSGDPVPDVFTAIAADPTGWEVVAHGIEFDRAIYEHILVARHGFPPLPLDIQHCSMCWRWRTPIQRNWPDCAPRWGLRIRRIAKAHY